MRQLARVWQAKVLALVAPAVKRAQLGITMTIQCFLFPRVAPRPHPVSHVLLARSRVALARQIVLTVPLVDIKTVLQQQPAKLALKALT